MADFELDKKAQKWLREKRGSGSGKEYKPWLTVRDLPSQGRSHRVFGHLTQRTHHLLSDLELAAFFLFDWNTAVTDIREQFPLRIEDTLEIAVEAGIRHPAVQGQAQVMSTDFLVDTSLTKTPRMAIQVKTSTDLFSPRTIEKLELERRYWEKKGIPWFLLTEKQMPKTVIKNIAWLYPAQQIIGEFDEVLAAAPNYIEFFLKNPTYRISQAVMTLDNVYCLEPGEALRNIRSLMALRIFLFDIRKPWTELRVSELRSASDMRAIGERYAANQ